MPYTIELKHPTRRHLAVVRFRTTIPEIGTRMSAAFGDVMRYLQRHGVPTDGPAIARYDHMDGASFDVTAGFPIAEPIPGDGHVVPDELPECEAVSTVHMGSYQQLPDAYQAIQAWVQEHHRDSAPAMPMWEEYFTPPGAPPDLTRTDVYFPLQAETVRSS